jgi:hypothetical protein
VVVIGDGAAAGVDTQCTLRCARAADVAGFEGAVSCRDIGLTVLSDLGAAPGEGGQAAVGRVAWA